MRYIGKFEAVSEFNSQTTALYQELMKAGYNAYEAAIFYDGDYVAVIGTVRQKLLVRKSEVDYGLDADSLSSCEFTRGKSNRGTLRGLRLGDVPVLIECKKKSDRVYIVTGGFVFDDI